MNFDPMYSELSQSGCSSVGALFHETMECKQWELHADSDDLWYNNTHILIVSTRESAGYRMYI